MVGTRRKIGKRLQHCINSPIKKKETESGGIHRGGGSNQENKVRGTENGGGGGGGGGVHSTKFCKGKLRPEVQTFNLLSIKFLIEKVHHSDTFNRKSTPFICLWSDFY